MKRFLGLILLAIGILSCTQNRGKLADAEPEPQQDTVYPLGFCTDSFRVVSGRISSGDNFIGWLTRLGVSQQDAHALTQVCDTVFDVRKLRAGNSWKAYYQDSTVVRYVVYDNNRERQTVFSVRDSLAVWT